MNEEKNQKVLAIVLVIAVISLGVYKLFFQKTNEPTVDDKIKIVKDVNDFYTASSCVDKFFLYSNSQDTDNLLILLSDEYKKSNGINSNNLYSYIEKFDNSYVFEPRKMYEQQIGKNKTKYYIYGKKHTGLGSIQSKYLDGSDYYIIVILDRSNFTFAVEPYDGESFYKIGV